MRTAAYGSLFVCVCVCVCVCLSVCVNTLRFLVCVSVTDVGVAVTNLRVVCKIIACCWSGHSVTGYAKDAIVDACHRTNDGQEHKIIWRAGPEQDFLLTCHSVQRARQPLSRRAISLGSFTGAVDFILQLIRLESLGSELQQRYITTFILWLINSPCTDRK